MAPWKWRDAEADWCQPNHDIVLGRTPAIGYVTCAFAVQSAIAAGVTGEEVCEGFAKLTLNQMVEQFHKDPVLSDFELDSGWWHAHGHESDRWRPDSMHVIELCEWTCAYHRVGRCFPSNDGPILLAVVAIAIAIAIVVVCILKKKKRCCFRAKTLPNEVTPSGVVSRTDLNLGPISSQTLNSDLPYSEVL